jgi:hypothetical protein
MEAANLGLDTKVPFYRARSRLYWTKDGTVYFELAFSQVTVA